MFEISRMKEIYQNDPARRTNVFTEKAGKF